MAVFPTRINKPVRSINKLKQTINKLLPRATTSVMTNIYNNIISIQQAQPEINIETLEPPVNRGLTDLSKGSFTKTFNVWSVLFPEQSLVGPFVKNFKNDVLNFTKTKYVAVHQPVNGTDRVESSKKSKVVLLTHKLCDLTKKSEVLSKDSLSYIEANKGEFLLHKLTLGYDFWRADQILRSVLPVELLDTLPTSYTITGHVAHLNLRDEFKPYDSLIGKVIMDKNKVIKTVVDKQGTIDTTFRTFKMKVIAGTDDLLVEQKESDCIFQFDFSKVYWNSRLATEHERLIDCFQPGAAICDVMAGVGPFAIPAGKKGCIVFANDLNPDSYKYLESNIKRNKVSEFVQSFNEDGRDFIKNSPKLIQEYASKNRTISLLKENSQEKDEGRDDKDKNIKRRRQFVSVPAPTFFSHYIMNLPDSAIKFIDSFVHLFSNAFPELTKDEVKNLPGYRLPIINFYHFEKFSNDEDPSQEQLHKRIHEKMKVLLKYDIPLDTISFHVVRMVAPTKPMYCISFKLPEEVAFA